jgi:acetyltransferase-like isoleucine patch superfamily enzyme
MSAGTLLRRFHKTFAKYGRRVVQFSRILFYRFISESQPIGSPKRHQPLFLCGRGIVQFDGRVHLGVFPSPKFLSSTCYLEARNPGAKIQIGDGTCINNDFTAIAEFSSIKIGKRVLIGTSVEIYDSNFHGLSVDERLMSKQEWSKPVVIEDDVFIGSNVSIMKGVRIGRGSIIASGSVVVQSVSDGVIVGGNPAKFIRFVQEKTVL